MINPYGTAELKPLFVSDDTARKALKQQADTLPGVLVNSTAAANAVMLGGGYFTPLSGFMNLNDAVKVAEEMHTTDGLFWPVPVMNRIDDVDIIGDAKQIALRDPNVDGNPVIAIQDIESIEVISDAQKNRITEKVFCTMDQNHPGVAAFASHGKYVISGPIQVLNFSYF